MLQKGDKRYLSILFLLGLLLRGAVFYAYLQHDHNYWQIDSDTYHRVACSVAQGDGFVNSDGSDHFYRLPGYPVFVAFFYKLFGSEHTYVLWAQIVVAAFIPLLMFLLSLTLFPTKRLLARCVGALGVSHLGLILYSGFFMTETLFMILFLGFCIFFFRSIHLWFCPEKNRSERGGSYKKLPWFFFMSDAIAAPAGLPLMLRMDDRVVRDHVKSWGYGDPIFKNMVMAGLLLGMASLVRPVGHYVLLLALLIIVVSNSRWPGKAHLGLTFFIAWLVPVGCWLLRNFLLTGYLFFTTLPGGHFLYLSAARVTAAVNHCSYQQGREIARDLVQQAITDQEKLLGRPLLEIERCYQHEAVARHYFIKYPLMTLKTWALDIFRTCFSLYSAELLYLESGRQHIDYFAQGRTLKSLMMRYLLPATDNALLRGIIYGEIVIFLLLIIGLCLGLLRLLTEMHAKFACVWFKTLPLMKLFIILALAGGYARMRLPIEPLLIILSLDAWLITLKIKKW